MLFDEDEERLKHLRRERHGLAVSQQPVLINVHGEVSEPVEMADEGRHNRA